jgi:hypothetical protein
LGISVHQVEVIRAGAEHTAATSATLQMVVDQTQLATHVRSVGKGRTVFLPGLADDTKRVASVLAALLPDAIDGRLDERFATETDCGPLWFDANTARIWQP